MYKVQSIPPFFSRGQQHHNTSSSPPEGTSPSKDEEKLKLYLIQDDALISHFYTSYQFYAFQYFYWWNGSQMISSTISDLVKEVPCEDKIRVVQNPRVYLTMYHVSAMCQQFVSCSADILILSTSATQSQRWLFSIQKFSTATSLSLQSNGCVWMSLLAC